MPTDCSLATHAGGGRSPCRSWLIIAGFATLFAVLRVPVMYRQFGGHDEEYFTAPSWTVLQEGIPRLPYIPSRNRRDVFYKADEVVLAYPPAYFYWQAVVFAALGPSYGSGQLAAGLAGMLAVVLVYRLGRHFFGSEGPALWAAGLYSVSRLFYLPAMHARPDALCAAIALGAILAATRWQMTGLWRWLAAAGALAGLALLTHPFAGVVWVQVTCWPLVSARGWRNKVFAAALAALCSLLVVACWLPLILVDPDVFHVQFFNNVLGRAGPGLLWRLISPWESIVFQARLFWENGGPAQTVLAGGGLAIATVLDLRRPAAGRRLAVTLAWSSMLLLVVFQGTHPVKAYWCYPGAFLFLCVARSVEAVHSWVKAHFGPRARSAAWGGGVLLVAIMLPGSGLRAWAVHLAHWDDIDYDKRRFARRLLDDLPGDASYVVDSNFVLDFYLAGRKTVLAGYARGRDYDYVVVGPRGLDTPLLRRLAGPQLRSYGIAGSSFACYAEVYRARPPARAVAAGHVAADDAAGRRRRGQRTKDP